MIDRETITKAFEFFGPEWVKRALRVKNVLHERQLRPFGLCQCFVGYGELKEGVKESKSIFEFAYASAGGLTELGYFYKASLSRAYEDCNMEGTTAELFALAEEWLEQNTVKPQEAVCSVASS